ncbi:MAG: AMP-binding protein, partial [Gemmatimonadales bacterium]
MTSIRDAGRGGRDTEGTIARQVLDALTEAEHGTADDARSMDREAVQALQGSPDADAALRAVEVERLAALLDRAIARLGDAEGTDAEHRRIFVWDVLDIVRRSAVLDRIERDAVPTWADRLLRAVETSHFTIGPLFRHRAATYGAKVLFEVPEGGRTRPLSWVEVAARINGIARGLLALDDAEAVQPVAVLSENRLEMALVDLACLTAGIENVLIPGNATDEDVGYILQHAGVRTIVVSTPTQLGKVRATRARASSLARVVIIDPRDTALDDLLTLQQVEGRASEVPEARVIERGNAVRIGDRATVMYTSGTTGKPKGIQFSHRNLVFKRFARALALPAIGDEDVFLAYLPLFHTFGRFFEMLGSVFWGAKYCFLLDPSVEALIENMGRHRPTVFISVPRKWMQLHEAIAQRVDLLQAQDEEIRRVTQDVTGGRLRWGLSAAGHLDADVFKFFQRQGIELMSGFGMSEATGGITMTPPGEYKDNSLGRALPGIELRLADDGELLIRGPYVMMGYLDPPDGEPSFDEDGWLPSGDLMRMDEDGHIQLVDRKKEIYKNVKGQTVAPQRIENLFREFESVGRAFLVGDHREYNTLLIYPNPAYEELDFAALPSQEVREHFRSLVVSVNKFVAPFERIVDFAVIDRDLDEEKGELTPKGTPRRKAVVDNFADVIDALYHRASLKVGGVEVTVPNWLFQNLGLTTEDIRVEGERVVVPSLETSLVVREIADGEVQVGDCRYGVHARDLNLGALLATPRLWLGNVALVALAPLDLKARDRAGREQEGLTFHGFVEALPPSDAERDRVAEALRHTEWDLHDLDAAARLMGSGDDEAAQAALRLLERVVSHEEGAVVEPTRFVLARTAEHDASEIRRHGFQTLVPVELQQRFRGTLEAFFRTDAEVLDAETSQLLCERGLPEGKLEVFEQLAESACMADDGADRLAAALLRFLAEYGAAHPLRFRRTRAFLVRMARFAQTDAVRSEAAEARGMLEQGFRAWLGPTSKIAVDTETAQEYRWEDVVVFEEGVSEHDRRRLLSAIKNTPFLREAVFLFYRGTALRLSDIPPGGVWIRMLGERHGKAVYRITVQTRRQEAYETAVNMNRSLTADQVREEIDWLVVCGEGAEREPVVEEFGGYLPHEDLWSEEFISGET